jgi:hypothetical protein
MVQQNLSYSTYHYILIQSRLYNTPYLVEQSNTDVRVTDKSTTLSTNMHQIKWTFHRKVFCHATSKVFLSSSSAGSQVRETLVLNILGKNLGTPSVLGRAGGPETTAPVAPMVIHRCVYEIFTVQCVSAC